MANPRSNYRLEYNVEGGDTIFRVIDPTRGGRDLPTSEWVNALPEANGPLSTIFANSDIEARDCKPEVVVEETHVKLSAAYVAALSASDASGLGLPAPTALGIDLKSRGLIYDREFRIESRWVRPGGSPVRAAIEGPFIESGGAKRRIPEPLFSVWLAAQRLVAPLQEQERFGAIAALRAAMPDDARAAVSANAYLADTRIFYASSVSLALARSDAFDFDPVLFSERSRAEAEDDNRVLDEEDDKLLSAAAQKLFATDRFRRQPHARPIYVLRDGEYAYVDPGLLPVLNEIRILQDAPREQRLAFLANPRRVLRERLGEQTTDSIKLEQRFVETEQFSDRVAGVDIWRTPVLPWVKPSRDSWLPESFGLRIGEQTFIVRPEHVQKLHQRVEGAAAAGQSTVSTTALIQPSAEGAVPPGELPVTEQLRQSVSSLAAFGLSTGEDHQGAGRTETGPMDESNERPGPQFLIVRENLDEVSYSPAAPAELSAHEPDTPLPIPEVLKTTLKPHQLEGFRWLARAYNSARPGALLADDMGLGKTLQALTFIAWLQTPAANHTERLPFLIVAPTGLLQNWREEIERHLAPPRVGELVLAFGSELRLLREEGLSGNDIQKGRAGLDSAAWTHAGVVLTTYETLRDYHFSFARTRFGLLVFDEIQKLKNPASQLTRAAKTLNSRFTLGMTGTPVENRLQDLWSIMDVVSPGLLGSSRDFERRYPADESDKLKGLKTFLTAGSDGSPAIMLRRLKADHLPGLPDKISHAKRLPMPLKQADAYRDVVNRAVASREFVSARSGMLPILHAMRGISLHPIDPAQAPADLEAYARDSARLNWTLELLDGISKTNEKALIFVESLAMQERLSTLVQSRYQLPALPLRINGAVPGTKRQEFVNRFQSRPGSFDVMILSPKAGGVGLNLTAANHVIHLSRWWNPAVEDQSTDRCFRIGQTKPVHVYLPMAVHPDPAIAPSSFDLKLNDLLERKRGLSRDMLAPPAGDDTDITDLFNAVTLGDTVNVAEEQSKTEKTEGADESAPSTPPKTSTPTSRPILSLNMPVKAAPILRKFKAEKGQARPLDEIAKYFSGKRVSHVKISDPYALADGDSRLAQVRFLQAVNNCASALEAVTLQYDPEVGDDADRNKTQDVRAKIAIAFQSRTPPRVVFNPKRRGRQGMTDFHNREVEVYCTGESGSQEIHTLWIGRGLISLVDRNYALQLTYEGPGTTA